MKTVFNEKIYAENLLKDGFTDYLTWKDLLILSKYFRSRSQKKSEIKKSIIEFYKKFSVYNETVAGAKIDNAIKKGEKYILRISPDISITKSEVEKIRALKNYKLEKICFVMIIISRSNKIAFNSQSSRYYLNMNFSEILVEAKVHASKADRNKIKHELFKLNMICAPDPNKMSEYNNHGEMFELLFIEEDSTDEIIVTDMNNIILFYPQKCIQCGKEISDKKRGKRSNLCNECYNAERLKRIR